MRLTLAIFVVTVLLSLVADARAQSGPLIDDIKRAWQKRQDSIRTLRVTWSEVRTQPKGYFDLILPDKNPKNPRPPTDIRLFGRGTITFDDHNCRFEINRSRWSVTDGRIKDSEEVNAFKNGKDSAVMTKSPIGEHASATISRRKKPSDIMQVTYWPITCFARGLNPVFAPINLDEFEITGNTPTVDGKRCIELSHKSRANRRTEVVLLDPARAFVLTRYYIFDQGQVILRLDVRYVTDPNIGWIPKSWDFAATTPKGGIRLDSQQIKQESWELNPALPTDAFDTYLPPGAQVYDAYSGEAVQYVVDADGSSGPAIPDKNAPDYDQLAALTIKKEKWSSVLVWTVIVASIVCVALLVLLWRAKRHPLPSS